MHANFISISKQLCKLSAVFLDNLSFSFKDVVFWFPDGKYFIIPNNASSSLLPETADFSSDTDFALSRKLWSHVMAWAAPSLIIQVFKLDTQKKDGIQRNSRLQNYAVPVKFFQGGTSKLTGKSW